MPSRICSWVLFYSYRQHRSLHSFPTRRSSDLMRSEIPVNASYKVFDDALAAAKRYQGVVIASPPAFHVDQSRHPGNASDRKSTRLNSSHITISYAVFCLKKEISV